jgi:hypothetical protein
MMLDPIDMAFLDAFTRGRFDLPALAAEIESSDPDRAAGSTSPVAEGTGSAADSILRRLLLLAPDEWGRLADRIEESLAGGCRVFAVVGSRPGEGRTTVVGGLVATLRQRGRTIDLVTQQPQQPVDLTDADEAAEIVIVDACNWFPSGPVRRGQLARIALGCDAAIFVRRADRGRCAAHDQALAAVGLAVLGEALTFTVPDLPDRGDES